MALVETVGVAAAQGAHAYRQGGIICPGEDLLQHGRTKTTTLKIRMDVEVIEQLSFVTNLDHNEADTFAPELDMTGFFRREASYEALA